MGSLLSPLSVFRADPQQGAGRSSASGSLLPKSVARLLSFVTLVVSLVWYYFWQKRRAIWQRVVEFALAERAAHAADDETHLETRFGSRSPCNVVAAVPNFRDVCASDAADVLAQRSRLRTRSGERLKAGLLFRSSNLHAASITEEQFKALKAKTGFVKIIDLRNLNERREDGATCRKEMGEKNLVSVSLFPLTLLLSLVDVPTQIRIAFLFALRPSSKDLAVLGQEIIVKNCNLLGLRGVYLLTLEYNKKLVLRVLQELTREAAPVVLQCGAGKDATGLIVALLMVALELADDDILYSYQMSAGLLNVDWCTRKREMFQNRLDADFLEPVTDFFTASSPNVIQSVLDFLREQYGSPLAYLDHIGFNVVWRTRLQTKFVESRTPRA